MYVEMYTIKHNNFKFMVELDTSTDVGENQLSLWCCEKADIHTVPLEQIDIPLLFKALKEPHRSLLLPYLEDIKRINKQPLEQQINELQQPFMHKQEQRATKIPGKTRGKIKRIRKDIDKLLQQIEQTFVRDEILTLELDCFNLDLIANECEIFGEWQFLRAFYFEEANEKTIQNFCEKFVASEDYRQQIRKGEQHWIKRNALFMRNLIPVLGEHTLLSNDGSAMRRARELFRWLDIHTDAVLALPEYQRLLQQDLVNKDDLNVPDQHIRASINVFAQMPGVKVHLSCQGVSGRVHYQDHELLALTYHEAFAYISFNSMSQFVHDSIITILAEYSSITLERMPCNFALCFLIRSTGDNLRFREEVHNLAQRLQTMWQKQQVSRETSGSESQETDVLRSWRIVDRPVNCPPTDAEGGMLPGRRQWLCRPEQIENTLPLLYHLNHWAKASDILFYNDRQGLYRIKTALLKEAYQQGCIIPSGYIDGSKNFVAGLYADLAASLVPDTLFFNLDEAPDAEYAKRARALFQRISGQAYQGQEDSEKVTSEQVEDYICKALQALVEQACVSRQPIEVRTLEELLVSPTDFIEINSSRALYISDWDDLDADDLRKLDPEGWSLVSMEYRSETAHYVFHLPYRIAEKFLATEQLQNIRESATESREVGISFGRALTKEESEYYPIEEILKELQVRIDNLCPRRLERKTERVYHNRPVCDEFEYDDDDDWEWEDINELPPARKRKEQKKQQQQPDKNACPLCKATVEPVVQSRIEHWRQEHEQQDLTIRKAYWLLCTDEDTFKQLHVTPDYRQDDRPDGTRYWKLPTLAKVVELLEEDKQQNCPYQEQLHTSQ